MERDLWAELSAAVTVVDRDFYDNPDFTHPTARVVRVHLWAGLHDRPTRWACEPAAWGGRRRRADLPHQSTMSSRVRTPEFEAFMRALEMRMRHRPGAAHLFKRMDAKVLPVAAHSKDRDAGWGRGAGQLSKGYKLHVIWGGFAVPDQWRVAPLGGDGEQAMARRMLRDLDGQGYVVADKGYDANRLFDRAGAGGHQLVCPRRYGRGKGLGHHRHSPHRLRSKDLTEAPAGAGSGFGRRMLRDRAQGERDFGNLVTFGGGLNGLPAWVRRHGRVRRWVWAKLLINAARIRVNDRRKSLTDE